MATVTVKIKLPNDEYDGLIGVVIDDSIVTGKRNILEDDAGKWREVKFKDGKSFSFMRRDFDIVSIT